MSSAPTGVADARATDAPAALAFDYAGPVQMQAGSLQRWTLRFTANADLPAGARIAVAHRWPNDWGIAQAGDPAGIDYLEVEATNGGSVRWWHARLPTWHPFDHVTFVDIADGLARGQRVEMRYGDDRAGSPGYRVQTFLEESSPQSMRWQSGDGAPWQEFARLTRRIVGAAPAQLVLTVPSRVAVGEAFDLHLRIEDRWGNPATLDAPVDVEIGADAGDPATPLRWTIPLSGWLRRSLTLQRPGIRRLTARTVGSLALEAAGNPVEAVAQPPAVRLYWGDLHGQSLIGCGARSIDAYYAHARDFSGTDFSSHQANCFLVSGEEWEETQASTQRHHDTGRFVSLLGVEWSAASPIGGDHNLYFPGDAAELHRCSHEFVADKSDVATDLPHVEDLYRHYRNTDTLVAVHVGGRTANLEWHEPGLDRLLEVHSTHATSEWFLFDALRRGYRMGVIAGSDGVDGRPGNSHPGHMGVRNVRGGLTAIFAPELSRPALWQALRQRHCYATTGERILLDFRMGGARMGDAIDAGSGRQGLSGFEVRVEGTAPLEQIDFFRGTQRLQRIDCFAAAGAMSRRLRVAWKGASAPGNWERARMRWDGMLRVAGTRIAGTQGYAFDSPDEGIVEHHDDRIRWRSVTAGDWDGVVVDLESPAAAELWFVTAPMTLRTRPGAIGPAGRRFTAHDPERCVEMRWLPERAPPSAFAGTFVDPAPVAGEQAYWVRVRQSDGALAWSSPIFVATGR